jgi:hypothetical protein
MNFLRENEIYSSDYIKRCGLRFMYYNFSTNHEIYRLGDFRMRFEKLPEGLKFLGILYRENSNDKKV